MKNIIEVLERARTWIEVQPVPRIDGAGSLVVELGKAIDQLAAAGKPIDAIAPRVEPQETESGAGFESPLASPNPDVLIHSDAYIDAQRAFNFLKRFLNWPYHDKPNREAEKNKNIKVLHDSIESLEGSCLRLNSELVRVYRELRDARSNTQQQEHEWVGLSDADIKDAMLNLCAQSAKSAILSLMHQSSKETVTDFRQAIDGIARAIEVKLKEKNK